MKVIIGLGNIGKQYENTFHNIGFMVIDEFAKKHGLKDFRKACDAEICIGDFCGEEFVLAKPTTFMNASGNSVKKLFEKYASNKLENILIIYDDADLEVGNIRMRMSGSAGTHNGMRNIVSIMQNTDIARLRLGIKNDELKQAQVQIIDHVLGKIKPNDKDKIKTVFPVAIECIEDFISNKDPQRIIEKVNRKRD
jgi:aminoacyl-tRNA hydrolase